MSRIRIALGTALLILSLGLTACVSQDESQNGAVDGTKLVGLSGADMSGVLRSDDLQYSDTQMIAVCNGVWGYVYGATRSSIFDPDAKTFLSADERKQSLRNADYQLKQSLDSYAEFTYYRQGIAEELLNPGSKNKYYELLFNSCVKYLKVQKILEAQYVPALEASGGCWNIKGDISAELQEKISGDWEYLDEIYSLSQITTCTDPEYPWGADFTVSRWLSDPENRTFRIVWRSSNFSSGKYVDYSCPVTSGRDDESISLTWTCDK